MTSVWNFSIPSNNLVCGPSNCGKTTFVERVLENKDMWSKPIDNLYYCYGIATDNLKTIGQKFPGAVLMEGIPRNLSQPREIFQPSKNNVLILDDLSMESQNSPDITNFMVKGSHHTNTCFLSLEHFLFADNAKERRKQAPHWHQMVLFRNKRALHQIGTLARQCSLGDAKSIQWAFGDATENPYSYLIIDMRDDTPSDFRFVTNVFCDNNEPTCIYKL